MATNDELSVTAGHAPGLTARVTGSVAPDATLDIRAETCPMTFVRTRLALDRLVAGQTLLVLLRGEEPRARVPATAQALGHEIVERNDTADGEMRLLIRRG